MRPRLGVVMDPIERINYDKDTSLALMIKAQERGWPVSYMELGDLFVRDSVPYARMREITGRYDPSHWYDFGAESVAPLKDLDVILMRKDPPFDAEYIYATYLLELAEAAGVLVINKPQGLRDANEKLFTAWFPNCCPPSLVTRDAERMQAFLDDQGEIVVKPLDSMGGTSIFRLKAGDPNAAVVFDLLTARGTRFAMAQRFLPAIADGDKRITLLDGEPLEEVLVRVPPEGDWRGNLVIGARGLAGELTGRDRWLCSQIGPTLRAKGLLFVGLDVIGDLVTEINVTSPSCTRQIDAVYRTSVSARVLDMVERQLAGRR